MTEDCRWKLTRQCGTKPMMASAVTGARVCGACFKAYHSRLQGIMYGQRRSDYPGSRLTPPDSMLDRGDWSEVPRELAYRAEQILLSRLVLKELA